MRKKARGFTVLELIITLSLTVVVLGVVYTFFLSNSKTLAKTEINSDLQLEVEGIQNELLLYGTQAEGIISINNSAIDNTNKFNYEGLLDENGKLKITNLKFRIESKEVNFKYNSNDNTLSIEEVGGNTIVLSKYVTEFKTRPLDYQMNPKGNFYETTGLEISLVLNKKKGYSDVTMPVSVIVKLRNKK